MPARLTTGAVLAAVVAAVLVALVYGCGVVGGGEPEEADTPPCDSPTVTDLGVPFGARVASFTFSGGEVFVEVSDLTQDTPLGDVTRTRIDLGPADRPPTPDPQGSSRMVGTEHQVSVELGRLSRITLPEGSYWLASSNGGRIRLHTCDDVQVDEVQPAGGEAGAG